jgi:hypothetical protein
VERPFKPLYLVLNFPSRRAASRRCCNKFLIARGPQYRSDVHLPPMRALARAFCSLRAKAATRQPKIVVYVCTAARRTDRTPATTSFLEAPPNHQPDKDASR